MSGERTLDHRILVLSELGTDCPLTPMKVPEVDATRRAGVAALMAAARPHLRLELPGLGVGGTASGPLELTFQSLADFEPASLLDQVPELARLRELGDQIASAAGGAGSDVQEGANAVAPLLPSCSSRSAGEVRLEVEPLLKAALGASVQPQAADLLAAIAARLSERLGQILQDPGFRRLEASWRGLNGLLASAGALPEVEVVVLDLPRAALRQDEGGAWSLSADAAREILATVDGSRVFGREHEAFSILVLDLELDAPEQVGVLTALGEIARRISAMVLTSVGHEFIEKGSSAAPMLVSIPNVKSLFESRRFYPWLSFRDTLAARRVVACYPRVLVRPHHAEVLLTSWARFQDRAGHDGHLWGSPAYPLAAALLQEQADGGWPGQRFRADCGSDHCCARGPGTPGALVGPTELPLPISLSAALAEEGLQPVCGLPRSGQVSFPFGVVSASVPFRPRAPTPAQVASAPEGSPHLSDLLPALAVARHLRGVALVAREAFGLASAGQDLLKDGRLERCLRDWLASHSAPDSVEPPTPRRPLVAAQLELAMAVPKGPPSPESGRSVSCTLRLRPSWRDAPSSEPLVLEFELAGLTR